MELKKNNEYKVMITDITAEGSGVCRIDGYAVFVPDTAVGDECIIKLIKLTKSYGYGKLVEITIPSGQRVKPDCEVFSKCGGCVFRHIDYSSELKIKQKIVADAFKRIGGFDIETEEIIGSKSIDGYRNKAQYPVSGFGKELVSGFYARHSHRIIGNGYCPLQPQIFAMIHSEIIGLLQQYGISGYDEKTAKGTVRHIYIRYGKNTNEIMVCFVVCSYSKKLNEISKKLCEKYSDIKSVIANINNKNTNVILGDKFITLCGNDSITDILCDTNFTLSPDSFYQVNHDQAEVLYNVAYKYAKLDKNTTLLDLYCGAGTIGLSAAKKVKNVIGVEIVKSAIENAKRNAEQNFIDNAQFICSDSGTAAQKLAAQNMKPDVIIVDPPRKGIDENVIDAIVTMQPKRLVMVSCNPSTAARDCKLLNEKGYMPVGITPVDMFPRTAHVETVVLMSRGDK